MRLLHLLPLVMLLVACKAQETAEVPFTSQRFHFAYTPPKPFVSIPLGDLNLKVDHPVPGEEEVFAAKDPGAPYGIVVIAEKMRVPTLQDPKGFRSGADFLSHIEPSYAGHPEFSVLERRHIANTSGLAFDELDYAFGEEFNAGMVFQVKTSSGDYLIVFRCNARSRAELHKMTQSVLNTRPV